MFTNKLPSVHCAKV